MSNQKQLSARRARRRLGSRVSRRAGTKTRVLVKATRKKPPKYTTQSQRQVLGKPRLAVLVARIRRATHASV